MHAAPLKPYQPSSHPMMDSAPRAASRLIRAPHAAATHKLLEASLETCREGSGGSTVAWAAGPKGAGWKACSWRKLTLSGSLCATAPAISGVVKKRRKEKRNVQKVTASDPTLTAPSC